MKLHHTSMTYNYFQHTNPHTVTHLICTNTVTIRQTFLLEIRLVTDFCVLHCHKNKFLTWPSFQVHSQNITLATSSELYRNVVKILPFMPQKKHISHSTCMGQSPMLKSQNWGSMSQIRRLVSPTTITMVTADGNYMKKNAMEGQWGTAHACYNSE